MPKTVELALKWIENEEPVDAIGQNGNSGEHYENSEELNK